MAKSSTNDVNQFENRDKRESSRRDIKTLQDFQAVLTAVFNNSDTFWKALQSGGYYSGLDL